MLAGRLHACSEAWSAFAEEALPNCTLPLPKSRPLTESDGDGNARNKAHLHSTEWAIRRVTFGSIAVCLL